MGVPPGPTALWLESRSTLFTPRTCVLDGVGRLVADSGRDGLWMLGGWYRLAAGRRDDLVLRRFDGLDLARTSGVGDRRWTVEDIDGAQEEFRMRARGRHEHVVDGRVVGEIRRGPFLHRIRAIVDLPALPPPQRVLAGLAVVAWWDRPVD